MDPDLQQKLEHDRAGTGSVSVRANNCLESAKISHGASDLVKKTDSDLLKVRSFGKTSLREVKRKLADMGLSLGMDLDAAQVQAASMADDDDDLDETEEGAETEEAAN